MQNEGETEQLYKHGGVHVMIYKYDMPERLGVIVYMTFLRGFDILGRVIAYKYDIPERVIVELSPWGMVINRGEAPWETKLSTEPMLILIFLSVTVWETSVDAHIPQGDTITPQECHINLYTLLLFLSRFCSYMGWSEWSEIHNPKQQ